MKKPETTQTEPSTADGRVELLRRVMRGTLAGLVPVLFVGFFLMNAEGELSLGETLVAVAQRVLMLALAGAVVAVAGLFGMRVLRLFRLRIERLFPRFILGAGLGLGTISLVTLGLGCAGFIGPSASALTLGAMFLVGIIELREIGNFVRGKHRPKITPLSFFELLVVLVCLTVLLFQVTLAFNLPIDYDACEYHVAAPARWFQLGGIDFIDGNVFSNLPMNCEMLYLFSMGLCGEVMLGIHLAVVMNAMTSVLAAGATYALARRFFTRRSALAASALFATTPWVLIVTTINVYNEILLAFYVTLALHAFLEFTGDRRAGWAILSAVFTGLAGGVKYTALAFLPGVLGVAVVVAMRDATLRRRIGLGLLYVIVALAVMQPWMVKNLAYTGNPTYPFFYAAFGGRDWSEDLADNWTTGQYHAAGAARAGNLLEAFVSRVVTHPFSSYAVAGFLLLGLLCIRERPVRWLLIFLVLWTVFWYVFTHRVDRFWIPMLPAAAVLAGGGLETFRHKELRVYASVVLLAALGYYVYLDSIAWAGNVAGSYNLRTGNDGFLAKNYEPFRLVAFARTLEADDHLVMVGEAQSLYLPPNVSYSTVFNEEIFLATVGSLSDPEHVRARLREARVTHVFVNWAEIGRLRDTYTWTDAAGETHPGFPPLSPRDFSALERAGVLTEIREMRYGKALGPVRGLTRDDLDALPEGKLFIFYQVNP